MTTRASQRQTAASARQAEANKHLTASALTESIAVLEDKASGKLTIALLVRETQAKFHIAPIRDPQQPRLWCVGVRQCSDAGMVDPAGPVWIDRPGQSWAELATLIETIRTDVGSWLSTPARRALATWLLSATPAPSVAEAAGIPPGPAVPHARSVAARTTH